MVASVRKTNRCVTVEEGFPVCSIGSYLSATLMEKAFDDLDAPVLTCTGKDVPMPYAANLEKLALVTRSRDRRGVQGRHLSLRTLPVTINILMPALSPTVEVARSRNGWSRKATRSAGYVIAEIETDKATMEVEVGRRRNGREARGAGGYRRHQGQRPDRHPGGRGEDAGAAAKSGDGAAKAETKPEKAPKAEAAKAEPAKTEASKPTPPAAPAPKADAAPAANGHASSGERTFASPLARRVAKDAGVDVWRWPGEARMVVS